MSESLLVIYSALSSGCRNSCRVVLLSAALSLFSLTLPANDTEAEKVSALTKDDGYREIALLTDVMLLIRERYVDGDKISYSQLVRNALKGMLHGLDPFSSFMEPRFYKQVSNEFNGSDFTGLGIHVSVKNGKLTIIAPLYGSPAYKAGLKPNDVILFIDGKPTSSMSIDECARLLKGKPGTDVTLTIHRGPENITKDIKVTREVISPTSVKWAYIKNENIGYIRISLFARQTAEDLDKALCSLKEKKISALVIDVRGNPGGLLSAAVEVCSRFIPKNKLIVFIEGRDKSKRRDFKSLDCDKTPDIPIAILVNGNSASAAEILSGCLQDHKRAVLVGQKTFGKGSVQEIISLPDKSALRLTIAKYYTPSKRVIHGHGIKPDVKVDVDRTTANKLYSQCLAYPGVVKPDYAGAVRDLQLERAIEILKGVRLFNHSLD